MLFIEQVQMSNLVYFIVFFIVYLKGAIELDLNKTTFPLWSPGQAPPVFVSSLTE